MLAVCPFPKKLLPLAALALLFAGFSPAQSTFGSFVGTVKDPSGGALVNCTVTVTNAGTSATRTTTTDSTGTYTAVNLEPGTYDITIDLPGFKKAVYTDIPLQARQTHPRGRNAYVRRPDADGGGEHFPGNTDQYRSFEYRRE